MILNNESGDIEKFPIFCIDIALVVFENKVIKVTDNNKNYLSFFITFN